MWLNFKAHRAITIFLLGISFMANAQQSKVIYNLRQNWLQYDTNHTGYLPTVAQESGKSVSFILDGFQFRNKQLYVYTNKPANLFFNNVLISSLNSGGNHFNIDSLITELGTTTPFLTIYRKSVTKGLETYIVNNDFVQSEDHVAKYSSRNPSFTSFLIVSFILLFASLVLIRFKNPDLFVQYSSVQRALNPQTIDELIYKGRFFTMPSLSMLIWMSFASGLISYILINKLNIHLLALNVAGNESSLSFTMDWLLLSGAYFLLFGIRYALVSVVSLIFDMTHSRNIHFANHLRLTYYLLLLLLALLILDYFSVISIGDIFITGLVFGALLIIIVLIGIRLSFIIRHTFVHLFLYLCGTEIFLFVFVYKLAVG